MSASNIGNRGRVCAIRLATQLLNAREVATVYIARFANLKAVEGRRITGQDAGERGEGDVHNPMDKPGPEAR